MMNYRSKFDQLKHQIHEKVKRFFFFCFVLKFFKEKMKNREELFGNRSQDDDKMNVTERLIAQR